MIVTGRSTFLNQWQTGELVEIAGEFSIIRREDGEYFVLHTDTMVSEH